MEHKICLVNSRLEGTYPPLGLGYLASYLEKYGRYKYEIKVVDGNYDQDIFNTIKKFNPKVIGFTGLSPQIRDVVSLSQRLRLALPESYQILGGIHATSEPEKSLRKAGLDYAVLGEGEETFQELADYLISKDRAQDGINKIPGIAYLKDDRFYFTGWRPEIGDLDRLPFPNRRILNMNYYLSQYLLIRGLIGNRITTVHASRGCPFDCSFCSSRIVFKKVRYFSCEYVIDELKELISKFKVRAVFFTDDTFILDKKRVWDLCESLIKSGLNKRLKWEVQGRANLLNWNDLGLLRLMKKAGCVQIDYGFEVGDDKVLRFLKKENVSVELNRRAIEITKKAGLRVLGTFMLAVPGENDAQMEKTRRFIKENFKDIDFFQVFIATPYPGSELYRICLEQGTVKEDYIEQIEKEEREDKIQIYSNSVTPKKVIEILSSLDKLMLKKISFFNKAGWLFYNLAHFPKDTVRRLLKFLLKNKT